ncbi:hypothetical protein BSZ22_12675 [Bradyrhizobium canariense]|uniref:Uncharacterized protein n=1 Tax=Bradyrhizobium canariense TaxID=255045 RepID=A0A1X3GJU8_9BRAD|nr:hypothetical protein BSZ22_12675 [Bradyrhizobium canariense]OSI79575.1 hypothetical protein BSZ23_14365 [Bradyrhizobium canariense]OSI91258.1 hypothetical protein BSZ24_18165 [Bradyrhizobium canariense]OSI91883.1 hypothetical protein BSZ25_14015 [Bradyrhizobium canariense]OSJ05692.1 hypothetical protein BSZ16_11795 [Bradyrhizobium canariense]
MSAGNTFDNFDFEAVPIISNAQVTPARRRGGWLGMGADLLLLGPPGGGKSHLVAAPAWSLSTDGASSSPPPRISCRGSRSGGAALVQTRGRN